MFREFFNDIRVQGVELQVTKMISLSISDRNVPRPALAGCTESLPTGRQEGAHYKMILHCREAPACGRGASMLGLWQNFKRLDQGRIEDGLYF